MNSTDLSEAQSRLHELLDEDLTIERGDQRQLGEALISVVDIRYTPRGNPTDKASTSRRQVRQTVTLFHSADLNLPDFAMSPSPKGMLGKVVSLVGGMGDINFDDSPEFSQQYYLFGWVEKPTRALFSRQVRDYFSTHVGWSIRAKGNSLAVYRFNQVATGDNRDTFRSDSLEIMSLFHRAEAELDGDGDLRRETTGADMVETAERMGGIAGTLLARQLRKRGIDQRDLDAFCRSQPPRRIPAPMKRQVLGETFVLVLIGLLFCVGGITLAIGAQLLGGRQQLVLGILLPCGLILAGALMAIITMRYRLSKLFTLARGPIVEATIQDVRATSLQINGEQRHQVLAQYTSGGETNSIVFNAYGWSVEQARKRMHDRSPIRIAVHPNRPTHGIALDLLMTL